MRNELFTKTFNAEASIAPYRITAFGAADIGAVQATGNSDAVLGVANMLGADAAGDRTDIVMEGIAEVELGGTVTRGDWLTSDADGKAVVSAPAAGNNQQVIGRAMVSGVAGDIGSVYISIGQNQG